MDDDYNDDPDAHMGHDMNNMVPGGMGPPDIENDGYDDYCDQDDDFGDDYRSGGRGRGNFRGRGRGGPPNWMGGPPPNTGPGPPMRFRGRGYGPTGPPMRGSRGGGGFPFRGRGGPPGGPGGGGGGPPPGSRFGNSSGGPGGGPGGPGGPNFDPGWGPMGPPPGMMGPGGGPPFGPPPGMMGPGGPMGPPPHMMGGPQYGGPPNMGPPPNQQPPELWVETKTDEGKSYFYHARSRETTWTRPQEGPLCKVITQAEVEVMAQNQSQANTGNQNNQMGGGGPPSMGMNGPPMGMMGPNGPMMGMMGGPNSGPPPYMNQSMGKNGNPMEDDDNSQDLMDNSGLNQNQGMSPNQHTALNFSGPPPGMGLLGPLKKGGVEVPDRQPVLGTPGFMGPPPGFAQGGLGQMGVPGPMGGQMPPPFMGPPPVGGAQANFPGAPWAMPGQGPPPHWVGGPPPVWGGPGALPVAGMPPVAVNPVSASVPSAVKTSPLGVTSSSAVTQHQNQSDSRLGLSPDEGGASPASSAAPAIPPELEARASEWSTHKAPDGRPYYYHAGNKESVWEKPQPLKDLEAFQKNAATAAATPISAAPTTAVNVNSIDTGDKSDNSQDTTESSSPKLTTATADIQAEEQPHQQQAQVEVKKTLTEQDEVAQQAEENARKREAEAAEREREKERERERQIKLQQDKSRPISSTPISGTPWCVVWTGDGRVFFYNPTAHSSVWERPEQLVGRADVDRAVASPPDALAVTQPKETVAAAATGGAATNGIKRDADDSSGDDAVTPNKKPRQDGGGDATTPMQQNAPATVTIVAAGNAATTTQIDLGKEAAIEAEVRAARERAMVPLDVRIKSFREMLAEKKVSAFSTWEKELHKIVFDSRYLVLTSKERKQVFDKYVRERAEEERKEKRNRLTQKKDEFRTLLEDAKLHGKSSFAEFSSKYAKEERFRALEKMRERESIFNEFIVEVRKKEKDERSAKKEQIKKDFLALLREHKELERHSRWQDVKKRFDADPRYKLVESSILREDYFRDYCKLLKEDKRKEKEKEREGTTRSSKREKKERDKEREKEREKDKDKKRQRRESEESTGSPHKEAEEAEDEDEVETAQAAQRAIKEREKEVQKVLATSLRDRDKEREFHKRDEAVQHFNALLADLVRNPDLAWREAKRQLKKDTRYALSALLGKEDKERLFAAHSALLVSRRRDKFRTLLDSINLPLISGWRDAKKCLEDKWTDRDKWSGDRAEREFREYQRSRLTAAKNSLKTLLQETRQLTHRTAATMRDNPNHCKEIEDVLKQDARYLALEHLSEDRRHLLQSYLEELEKRGPPPPPTASEPSRRSAK